MKVLMTTDTVGGVWVYAVELASALAKRDVEIVLATMGGPLSNAQRDDVAALANVRVHESNYRLEWMEDPWRDVDSAGEWLLELERREEPDVVHLNGFAHGVLPWRAPTMVVGHSCVLSWWHAVKGEAPPARWDEYTRRVRAGLHAAQLVVAPSYAMRASLDHHYGPLADVHVLLNGRSAAFHPGVKEPFIMSAGRLWDEGKNVAALARVAARLTWPVHVAGSVASPDGAAPPLGDLHALGQLSSAELAEWLSRASIYALPARYEPFGLSILEAALSGCALVLGDIPSLRELWGDAAAYVNPDDDEALVRALQRLQEDPPLRRALAGRARERALTLNAERMGMAYLAAYEQLWQSSRADREVSACAS